MGQGGTREQSGSNKAFNWSDLAGVGGVGQGGGQGGVDMGGGTREQCGSNKAFTGSTFWAPLTT